MFISIEYTYFYLDIRVVCHGSTYWLQSSGVSYSSRVGHMPSGVVQTVYQARTRAYLAFSASLIDIDFLAWIDPVCFVGYVFFRSTALWHYNYNKVIILGAAKVVSSCYWRSAGGGFAIFCLQHTHHLSLSCNSRIHGFIVSSIDI